MSAKSEAATTLFLSGANCAQSVLAVFCERYGLDWDNALKLCAGLGAGFRFGEVCGAVSGAVLVIGLKQGQHTAESKEAKDHCNNETVQFIDQFKRKNNSIVCREILGFDLSVKEEYEQAQKQNLFRTTCADMVERAVILLEELGY